MDSKLFREFKAHSDAGHKKAAKKAIGQFVDSFGSLSEKQAWTKEFLETLDLNASGRIRHELYIGVVFPALLEGYKERDTWSLLWLAKTIENLCSARHLHERIAFRSELDLLKEAYSLDKNSADIRRSLLNCLISWFHHCEHEWPPGILYGMDDASREECERILDNVLLARELDREGRFSGYLWSFESKLQLYRSRLQRES